MFIIGLKGADLMVWNGECFTSRKEEAALFHTKKLAEKAMVFIFALDEPPLDEDDAELEANLCVLSVPH